VSKSLLGGSAAAAFLSAFLIFYAGSDFAQTLAQSARVSSTTQPTVISSEVAGGIDLSSTDSSTNVPADLRPNTLTRARRAETEQSNTTSAPTVKNAGGLNGNTFAAPPQSFVATAYSLRGRTASGRFVNRGIIAADRKLLPLGTRVRLDAGSYSGEYLVADTGGAVRGRKIDIWMPSTGEALRFGRRTVRLTVLSHARNTARPRARR
jgi:3D (Asp-Asp-Asp) domain-containing protein